MHTTRIKTLPRSRPRLALAMLFAATAALQACSPASGAERAATGDPVVAYGAPVKVGNGTARTYIEMDGDTPTSIGVALTEEAMTGLQGHHEPGAVPMPDGHSMYEHLLPLPAVNPTQFKLVVLNWNPGGHEPPGIYDTPHFDFHFYTIDDVTRSTISPANPRFEQLGAMHPAPEFIAAGYVPAAPAVPGMGLHWVDPTSPELNGKPFTRTFIYGSWDGRVIFEEPMITKAYLESKVDSTFPLPRAARYERGYHANSYRIRWDGVRREYRVALTELEKVD
jgi:hypothetical protein